MLNAEKLEKIQKLKAEVQEKLGEVNKLVSELEKLGANPKYTNKSNDNSDIMIKCTVSV